MPSRTGSKQSRAAKVYTLPLAALTLAALASSTVASAAPSAAIQSPPSILSRSLPLEPGSSGSTSKRHGDHGDEDEGEEEEEHEHEHEHHDHTEMSQSHHDDTQHDDHAHQQAAHSTDGHAHTHAPSPLDSIPDALKASSQLLATPVLGTSHGGHHHGSGAPMEHLNETKLFRAKGPDPLSYIEWDYGYGVGALSALQRFTANADVLVGTDMMASVDGRWRKLLDERDQEQRRHIAADLASRIEGGQEPSRHATLLMMHVVTAVLSCFILLPLALVLRAAYSNLAPLASLVYLSTLGLSMFLSMVYKAMTPRLYPSNSHGGMGWSIFWLSLVCLGADVFRLVGQIWSILRIVGSKNSTGGGRKSWNEVMSTMLGKNLPTSSEKYDALEEEAMLSADGNSDAQEVDLERDLTRRLNEHSHRSSGSPHRVHFDDDQDGNAHPYRSGSLESVEEADWVGSGSTAVGAHAHGNGNGHPTSHSRSNSRSSPMYGDGFVSSPTTTACNTPRNSVFGEAQLQPLNTLKAVAAWRTGQNQSDAHSSISRPTNAASSGNRRLETLRKVIRYTHVTVARSLPIIAFGAAYTGLAVYTGSCRNSYKNVCLAHGIKGGIFFWYGLFTFARFLGAYADCGWAWNKRPSPKTNKKNASGWRRSMPSAEFIECLVIFVYGSTNTWMERFGARPGDPYTIKQIQHISIAVMFWFAGLVGMMLEIKAIRNLLSFPIAYHHAGAIPFEEVRRRRSHSRSRSRSRSRVGEEDELDELVDAQTQPSSYASSFNPFPALVIGVTGIAMAAHHQDYVYEVQIHMLWGELLGGFALLRCLTYFLLWLRPPSASVLPSRPPTEALAAFSLCCGGLIFMLSSEEVSFAAMRSGYGDFMAILNVGVAVVSLLFCWTTALMMIKGWAVRREVRRANHGDGDGQTGALRLDEDVARGPRRMRALVASGLGMGMGMAQTAEGEAEPVFVLEDEADADADQQASQALAG